MAIKRIKEDVYTLIGYIVQRKRARYRIAYVI